MHFYMSCWKTLGDNFSVYVHTHSALIKSRFLLQDSNWKLETANISPAIWVFYIMRSREIKEENECLSSPAFPARMNEILSRSPRT